MIHCSDRQFVHELIVFELAIRTLKYDFSLLPTFKMHRFYAHMLEQFVESLRIEYAICKKLLAKKGIRLAQFVKVDAYFCDVRLVTAGEELTIRYANQALKIAVEELLFKKLKNESLFPKKHL
ncbi:aconitate hydratase [Metasolibacillus meyeri]|uniref:Aconitate hydratase n=1 Tax=Metasolibacillus meyeri TaxID=1071052 RepID=A0AAW9NT77_9BACL|nr:aconitate hydratase [Metasolibacillus meyeri]MEC1179150.1 aconitate hydratase [Metasolibacillus meyeri]